MKSTSFRGSKIEMLDGVYVYSDNKLSVAETWQSRNCGHCNRPNTPEGHDACLGTIPNAMNACCGHGIVKDAYIQFEDGSRLSGQQVFELTQ